MNRNEITVELRNSFDPKEIRSYDISSLEVEVGLDPQKEFLVEDLTFMVALQEVDFFSYEDESDIEGFEIYLMHLNDSFGQHEEILTQAPKLPLLIDKPERLKFSIPIVSSPDQHHNFLDVIKQAPDHLLKNERELILHITCYLNPGKANEVYNYGMFTLRNPFWGK